MRQKGKGHPSRWGATCSNRDGSDLSQVNFAGMTQYQKTRGGHVAHDFRCKVGFARVANPDNLEAMQVCSQDVFGQSQDFSLRFDVVPSGLAPQQIDVVWKNRTDGWLVSFAKIFFH